MSAACTTPRRRRELPLRRLGVAPTYKPIDKCGHDKIRGYRDPLVENSLAFDTKLNPFGAPLRPMLGSDIMLQDLQPLGPGSRH